MSDFYYPPEFMLLIPLPFILLGVMTLWWVPLVVIGAIVVGVIIRLIYLNYKDRCEALIKRADEQHSSLMNGIVANDVEAMDLGFYGQFPPERIVA